MGRPLALDLFCGVGGAAMGLHRAGFDVVGIDIKRQPRYPFPFIQADALKPPVRLEDFDLIWASPPCQAHSKTRAIWGRKYPDLIEATRDALRARSLYVIENVPGAPLKDRFRLCGTMFGLDVLRHRDFESSFFVLVPGHPRHEGGTNSHRGMSRGGRYVCVAGHNFHPHEARAAMGTPWIVGPGLAQAIPPAYSEHIGRYAMMALGLA